MKEKLEQIRVKALEQIALMESGEASAALEKLNDVRVNMLGKKGELTAVLKGMKDVAPKERPKVGQMVNDTRAEIEAALDKAKKKAERALREAAMKAEVIDVTLPAKKNEMGHRHPNFIVLEEVERIFIGMGYEVVEGPEIEKDYYNFEALNIPADHPAKDEQDTFYINGFVQWSRKSRPSVCWRRAGCSVPMRWMPPILRPSTRSKAWSSTKALPSRI